jgi:ABC-type phosphate transport system permease subunit
MAAENSLSIGALSKATGTKVETIRWYERVGMLPARILLFVSIDPHLSIMTDDVVRDVPARLPSGARWSG